MSDILSREEFQHAAVRAEVERLRDALTRVTGCLARSCGTSYCRSEVQLARRALSGSPERRPPVPAPLGMKISDAGESDGGYVFGSPEPAPCKTCGGTKWTAEHVGPSTLERIPCPDCAASAKTIRWLFEDEIDEECR